MNNPRLIGITGGIGAGKSMISKVFKILGTPVYDADTRAKELMIESENLKSAIIVLFGEESYSDNELNRQHIASKAFHHPKFLTQLNELVHPAVREDFKIWVKYNQKHAFLVKEAALLFESGSYKELDKTILVTAPEDLRKKRVLKRDQHRTLKDVDAIMRKQMSDQEKEALADIVLKNDGTELLIPRIMELKKEFEIGHKKTI